jgi:hypothetical protein
MSGHLFPLDVYAWVAVFVIPVNAALNPFLYTFNNIKKKSVNIVELVLNNNHSLTTRRHVPRSNIVYTSDST